MAAAVCCFLVVRLMRASAAMWRVMWVFCQAHLLGLLDDKKTSDKSINEGGVETQEGSGYEESNERLGNGQHLLELQRSNFTWEASHQACHLPWPQRVSRCSDSATFRFAIVLLEAPDRVRRAADI